MFGKLLKMKYNLNPILHNRVILYILTAIALFDLIYFLNTKDMFSFLFLILIGFLTTFFNKNMTVILFITIVITHLLKYGKSSFSEGLDNMDNTEEDTAKNVDETNKKLDKYTKQMDDVIKSKKDDKSDELIDNLKDMQNTRDAIVDKVQNIKPLIEKFKTHLEQFENIKKNKPEST